MNKIGQKNPNGTFKHFKQKSEFVINFFLNYISYKL